MILEFVRGSKARVMILELVLAFLAARLFIYTGYTRYSAETEAESFFVKYMNADLDGIYDDLEITENEDAFINREAFLKANQGKQAVDYDDHYAEESYDNSKFINRCMVGRAAASRNREDTVMTIHYTGEEGSSGDISFQMERDDSKKFFLFKNWHVSGDNFIVKDFTIQVPEGAAVTVDGVALSKEYFVNSEYGVDSYVIPQIFKGNCEVMVSKEHMEDVTMQVNTAYDGACSVDSMELKPEIMQKAVKQAAADLKKLYKAAFQNIDFGNVEKLSVLSEEEEAINNQYSDLVYEVQYDRKRSLTVGDMYPTASYYTEDGKYYIEVQLDYGYSGIYEYEYWNGEISMENYSGNQSTTLVYCLDDSGLELASIYGLGL